MHHNKTKIWLASKSPRRQELLKQINVKFDVVDIEIDETRMSDEQPDQFVKRLALEKAQAGYQVLSSHNQIGPVLGSDTVVVADGKVLGKPVDQQDAYSMWTLLSGKSHKVMTAVALIDKEYEQVTLSISDVTFRIINPDEMDAYWETGEPLDKAGAYAVQGIGAVFIKSIAGSYSGVMGLPLYETSQLISSINPK